MGMNITGHFTFSPFSLSFFRSLPPSIICLTPPSLPPPLPAFSISLFLSVKVMQLIFLCLFIFQDWLWNVGSRQKPRRPLPAIALLSFHLFLSSSSSSSLCRPSSRPKTQQQGRGCEWGVPPPSPPSPSIPYICLLSTLLSLSAGYVTTFH